MIVYRVSFVGTELAAAARGALTAAGAAWEGTSYDPQGQCRHRALVEADREQDAIAAVRSALAAWESYGDFDASPVRDSRGEVWRAPMHAFWHEIDWQAEPRRARLTEVQRAVLRCLLSDAEPTWIIAADPDVPADGASVEAVLKDLREQGIVHSALAAGGESGRESETDQWWAVTDAGWDLLGLIKSPQYGWGASEP
jgi:hypothetical protein